MLTLRFRLTRRERRDVLRAMRAADPDKRHSQAERLNFVALDFLAGCVVCCAPRNGGLRFPFDVPIDGERLAAVELAVARARDAGARSDAQALHWVCATFLDCEPATRDPGSGGSGLRRSGVPTRGSSLEPVREEKGLGSPASPHTPPTATPILLESEGARYAPRRGHPVARRIRPPLVPSGLRRRSRPREPREGLRPGTRPGTQATDRLPFDPVWLTDFAARADGMYRPGWLPKRDGSGIRPIQKPDAILKAIQKWIADGLAGAITSPIAYGHVLDRDVEAAARQHARRRPRWFAVEDVADFFTSVTAGQVAEVFEALGYPAELAETLALICTREGTLPQGAPTSPAISSLVLAEVDRVVADAAKAHGCCVIRYCDDWAVSGDDRDAVERVVAIIAQEVERAGFTLHPGKSRVRDRRKPMIYLGLDVNHGRPTVPARYRERLFREVMQARSEGIDARGMARLRGQASYVERYHPREGRRLHQRLDGAPLKEASMNRNIITLPDGRRARKCFINRRRYVMPVDEPGAIELPDHPTCDPADASVMAFVEEEAARLKGLTLPLDADFSGELSPFTDPLDEDPDDG